MQGTVTISFPIDAVDERDAVDSLIRMFVNAVAGWKGSKSRDVAERYIREQGVVVFTPDTQSESRNVNGCPYCNPAILRQILGQPNTAVTSMPTPARPDTPEGEE